MEGGGYQMDVCACMCDLTSAFITLKDTLQDKTNAIKQRMNKWVVGKLEFWVWIWTEEDGRRCYRCLTGAASRVPDWYKRSNNELQKKTTFFSPLDAALLLGATLARIHARFLIF